MQCFTAGSGPLASPSSALGVRANWSNSTRNSFVWPPRDILGSEKKVTEQGSTDGWVKRKKASSQREGRDRGVKISDTIFPGSWWKDVWSSNRSRVRPNFCFCCPYGGSWRNARWEPLQKTLTRQLRRTKGCGGHWEAWLAVWLQSWGLSEGTDKTGWFQCIPSL